MNEEFEVRTTAVTIAPVGAKLYDARAIEVSIKDECGGEFVEVSQEAAGRLVQIGISPEEWPRLKLVIDGMIKACRSVEPQGGAK
jgi:hypothetical protein